MALCEGSERFARANSNAKLSRRLLRRGTGRIASAGIRASTSALGRARLRCDSSRIVRRLNNAALDSGLMSHERGSRSDWFGLRRGAPISPLLRSLSLQRASPLSRRRDAHGLAARVRRSVEDRVRRRATTRIRPILEGIATAVETLIVACDDGVALLVI